MSFDSYNQFSESVEEVAPLQIEQSESNEPDGPSQQVQPASVNPEQISLNDYMADQEFEYGFDPDSN